MIPVYRPSIGQQEKNLVLDALDSTWISSKGRYLEEFETEFSSYVGATNGVATCNGTVSIHLALAALGIGPGDEVIVPTFTYVASVNAIAYTGATPVFVDSEPLYWNLDPELLEPLITPNTKAILVVHLYGNPCDMDQILSVATRHNIPVIEDAAEAHGAEYKGRRVGSIGLAGSFSFFGNKVITTGEGGMVVTNDDNYAERCRHLRGQGVSKDRTYWHDVLGYNYRMTNITAAIGVAQLSRIDEILDRKRQIADWYRERIEGLQGLQFHREAPWAKNAWWMVSILVESGRDDLIRFLSEHGIETRPFFYPAHTLPMYSRGQEFPIAEYIASRGINLPSFPDITLDEVETVCMRVREFIRSRQQ